MSERGTSVHRESFVPELDDVAVLIKASRPEHNDHPGWSLRTPEGLVCSCGEVLYHPGAPER